MSGPWTYVSDIGDRVDQTVTIKGWVTHLRSSGNIRFIVVRDGTGVIQGIMSKKDVSAEIFERYGQLTLETSLEVDGLVRADARAPGGYELQISDLRVIHVAQDYPITPKEHGIGYLSDHRHLWLRSSKQTAILRIRAELVKACRDFFDDRGFTLVDSPIFTPNACEGTTTLFETDYFGEQAFLTQSGQLYQEPACAALAKTYCFGPTFRAEKSKTRRHLMEFWMLEPEIAFADLDYVMALSEEFLEFIVGRVLERRKAELATLERDVAPLEKVKAPFPRISYDEAVKILKDAEVDFEDGGDFGGGDETILAEKFDRPVIVHRFPAAIKAFYMKRDAGNPNLALGLDVLAPEGYGEIIGGGQREDDLETLRSRIQEHGLPEEAFSWYLDLRKYGSVPHAGFGMGLERVVSWVCGLSHIRETIPFPRMLNRLYP